MSEQDWIVYSDLTATRLYLGEYDEWLADKDMARIFTDESSAVLAVKNNEVATGYKLAE
jgi:hypothetical protein